MNSDNGRDADPRDYRLGLGCLLLSTLFTSTAGLLLRQVESAGGWQILFYRSAAFVAVVLLFLALRHGRGIWRAFRAVGGAGLATALFLGTAQGLFIFALLETTVANVVFTVSLSPFVAALLAWLLLREPVSRATLLAGPAVLFGVALMFADGLAAGGVAGNLLALACCVCFSAALVAMRAGRGVDQLPAVCLAGAVTASAAGVMAPELAVTARDLGIGITMGVVQLGFQYLLLTLAIRSVPAAEVALVGRLSLVLAPLWVWLAVDEVPGDLTLLGGSVILLALAAHAFMSQRRAAAAAWPAP